MSIKILNGLDLNSTPINNLPDATTAQQPATKAQLDAAILGIKNKVEARAASTGNLTLSGEQTVDGVALVSGDRVVPKDQSTASQNGVYLVSTGAWTRTTDADTAAEIKGMSIFIQEGTVNGNRLYLLSNDGDIVLGTTNLVYTQIGAGQVYTEGTGIDITSNVISLDTAVVARKTGANIGNGSATSFNVSHSLDSTDVIVLVREVAGGLAEVFPDVVITDTNTVTVSFSTAPTTNQYRVSVIG